MVSQNRNHIPCFDPKRIGRNWMSLNHHLRKIKGASEKNFTVLCYNILADCLLHEHLELYDNSPRWCLDWNYRRVNLLEEITHYAADIICLQEVQSSHYENWFLPSLSKQGYIGMYKKRTGDKKDGCAMFVKSSTFHVVRFKGCEFLKENIPPLDRHNVGIVALLEMINSKRKKTICVATTHLLFNPRRGDIKLLQIACLLAEISEVTRNHFQQQAGTSSMTSYKQPPYPIILCGDFNALPHYPLYNFIKDGELKFSDLFSNEVSGQEERTRRSQGPLGDRLIPDELNLTYDCLWKADDVSPDQSYTDEFGHTNTQHADYFDRTGVLTHGLQFNSAYRHTFRDGTPEVTTFHSRASSTVDFIFYSGFEQDRKRRRKNADDKYRPKSRSKEADLLLTGILLPLSHRSLDFHGGLPSPMMSSDHLPLVVSFQTCK